MKCGIPHPHFGPCDPYLEDVTKIVGHIPVTDEVLADAAAWRAVIDAARSGQLPDGLAWNDEDDE